MRFQHPVVGSSRTVKAFLWTPKTLRNNKLDVYETRWRENARWLEQYIRHSFHFPAPYSAWEPVRWMGETEPDIENEAEWMAWSKGQR